MARRCSVLDCSGDVRESRSKGLPLHKFPKDAELRRNWLASGGFHVDFKPAIGQLVCHRHFKSADYEYAKGNKFLLKRGTVPSVFSDYENHPDPVTISMKTSYPQEDLDLINSKISSFNISMANSEMKMESENNVENVAKNEAENTAVNTNEDKKNEKETDGKPKVINRGGLNFAAGTRLEAKDFSEKWYAARVVETDWVEREVLIHFDKWSSRFDEWIPMDSSRLRILQLQTSDEQPWMLSSPEPTRGREFIAGERVLATWADGRKYPARVSSVLGNDRYDVLFDDGYGKIVRSSKMTKIAGTVEKCMDGNEYIGSKQERRDRKRKHSVMELFSTHTKKKARIEAERAKKEGEIAREKEVMKVEPEQKVPVFDEAVESGVLPFGNSPQKLKSSSRKGKRDESKIDIEFEEDVCPEWINGEPQGTEAFIVEGSDGPRRSIIVPDKRLPTGWQKHFTQRKTGSSAGKWDVFFVHDSSAKKFRSRNEIKSYLETMGHFDFDPEKFDFCIHRKKRAGGPRIKPEPDVKKIKTLLPKSKPFVLDSSPGFAINTGLTPSLLPADDNAVFIGGLRVEMEDSAYKCPKEGCNKNFRKENLLQMHIKHYHPEYSKFLGSTPNVADLAYARTIGESIDDIIPKKSTNFLDRINKMEKRKEKTQAPVPLAPILSPMLNQTPLPVLESSPMPPVLEAELGQGDLKESLSHTSFGMGVDGGLGIKFEPGAISPGTAFDRKCREEKRQSGIKALFPVRHLDSTFDDVKKRTFLDYDFPPKSKKRQGQLYETRFDKGSAPKGEGTKTDSNNDVEEEGVMTMINGELVKLERLRREEIINCVCGIMEEDGLMIQCDVCLCWQHGHCNGIEREKDVPEKYICYICRYPYRQRPSKQYAHDQEWIKDGKLPSLPGRNRNQDKINQRTAMLKRSYDLVAVLLQIQEVLQSLRVKINVAEKKDHPKLYLWAKNWAKVEITKPDMEPVSVFEYAKAAPNNVHCNSEVSQNEEIKFELARGVKDDVDGKSIASDTELMKILEEDSMHSEESKVAFKNEDDAQNILLDALTKNDANHDLKNEYESSNQSTSMSNTPTPVDMPLQQIASPSANVPAQPFIPEPEAPIDPEECRLRLLDHIDHFQNHIDVRLTAIEAQVSYLEEMPNLPSGPDLPSRTKQTVQMLLRDLSTVRKLAASF